MKQSSTARIRAWRLVASSGTFKGPFGYGGPFGYQEDADSGLKLLGHRYYDPSTGRFLTRDPIKDGRNWYSYCENGPTIHADPIGFALIVIAALNSQGPPPPFPVPGGPPGTKWRYVKNPRYPAEPGSRPGKWVADPPIKREGGKGGQPSTSWEDRTGKPGKSHWDTNDGLGNKTRQDSKGRPLTSKEVHGYEGDDGTGTRPRPFFPFPVPPWLCPGPFIIPIKLFEEESIYGRKIEI